MTTDQDRATIRSLVQNNEIGFYNSGYFPAGTYSAEYTFRIHPPIEYDTQYSHLNIRPGRSARPLPLPPDHHPIGRG